LVKLTNKLIGKIKRNLPLFPKLKDLCNEIIEFCNETNNLSMKTKIQTRLAEINYLNGDNLTAIDLVSKTLIDLKKYEDNMGLIILQLLESKIHYASKGLSRAKASLTSVKTLCTKVYIEPKLQAKVDMHAGIIAAYEKDYNLAYSYFYESFDVFNIPNIKNTAKAMKAIQYMILCKIMNGSLDDINNIILGKKGQKYYGPNIKAFESIIESVKLKSVKLLKENFLKNEDYFIHDDFIIHHLENLKNDLIEKNLIKIIQPYSVVQIDFITNSIGLPLSEITMKISQMILDKKINGILDQGRGCLIIYDDVVHNVK
jgi:26S proteasome regulatory subunit N6